MSEKIPKRSMTEETYDRGAVGYTEKFESIGVRSLDVDRAFQHFGFENPLVVEIGCGSGREAEYILTKTDNYIGVDISAGLLEIAQEKVPNAQFVKADVTMYEFPNKIDIVFAFASLLHVNKDQVQVLLKGIHGKLNEKGLIYISLKRKDAYGSEIVEDEHGFREYFYYTKEDILEAVGEGYQEVFHEEQERIESWFTIMLRKR